MRILADRYELKKRIGSGAFGNVSSYYDLLGGGDSSTDDEVDESVVACAGSSPIAAPLALPSPPSVSEGVERFHSSSSALPIRRRRGRQLPVVAIKSIPYTTILYEGHRMIREIEIMLYLAKAENAHPNVISCLGVFVTSDYDTMMATATAVVSDEKAQQQLTNAVGGGSNGLVAIKDCLQQWIDNTAVVKAKVKAALLASPKGTLSAPSTNESSSSSSPAFTLHMVLPMMNADLKKFVRMLAPSSSSSSAAKGGGGGGNGDHFDGIVAAMIAGPQSHHRETSAAAGDSSSLSSPPSPPSIPCCHMERTLADIAVQILRGVAHLHSRQIVHRDLKPENVLVGLDASGGGATAVIADLGLARLSEACGTHYVCTRTYRPPELTVGRSTADPSIDVWSLGCIFYEVVTSRRLFNVPSSRTTDNQWAGAKAAEQLELLMDVVGTPSREAVLRYLPDEKDPVRSYLLHSCEGAKARPSKLRQMVGANFNVSLLAKGERREKERGEDKDVSSVGGGADLAAVVGLWSDLIESCLAFFPEQRPTAAALCAHPLFARYGLVKEHSPLSSLFPSAYVPTAHLSSRREKNVMTALGQVMGHLEAELLLAAANAASAAAESLSLPADRPPQQPRPSHEPRKDPAGVVLADVVNMRVCPPKKTGVISWDESDDDDE